MGPWLPSPPPPHPPMHISVELKQGGSIARQLPALPETGTNIFLSRKEKKRGGGGDIRQQQQQN